MAEIIQRDATWAFDGSTVRITPGLHRSVPLFRQTYGEVAVPLTAVAGVVYEPERRRGRLRLRLRESGDPLLQATGGRLPDNADPYRLLVEADRSGSPSISPRRSARRYQATDPSRSVPPPSRHANRSGSLRLMSCHSDW